MKTKILWLLPLLITGTMISGCSPRAKYERILKHELASGVRHDSLFMGIYFGMSQKDFYAHCWMLNRKGLIKQGPNNMTVEYEIKNELGNPATMYFYPEFGQGKIIDMPVKFTYNGWAPWNKKMSADQLELDILNWYKKVYGKKVIAVNDSKHGMAYVWINGNRRITLFKEDEMNVWAVFTDLSVKGGINKSTSKEGILHDEITKELEK